VSDAIETGRQFVNTWECDENDHLNVQFYFQHFLSANIHFWTQAGLKDRAGHPATLSQHVRFHRELAAGDLVVLHSHLAPHGDGLALCHIMTDAETGEVSATSLAPLKSGHMETIEAGSMPISEVPDHVRPRSLKVEPIAAITRPDAEAAGYACCLRSVAQPGDCNAGGHVSSRGFVGNLSNAASHFWNHIGLDKPWLNANGYGRVAVEFKLIKYSDIPPGTPLAVYSGLIGYSEKTITFRHFIFNFQTGTAVLAGEVTGLAIDLQTRRAVTWHKDRQARFDACMVS